MNNIRVTNIDNGVSIIMSKQQFNECKTLLSENTVYEYTNMPLTKINLSNIKDSNDIKYISKVLGGF